MSDPILNDNLCKNNRNVLIKSLKYQWAALREFVDQHKPNVARLLKLSARICVLESHLPDTILYSKELVDQIIGEVLSEANHIVGNIKDSSEHLYNSYLDLDKKYKQFVTSASLVDLDNDDDTDAPNDAADDNKLVAGNAVEKPLAYYVTNTCNIVKYLDIFYEYLNLKVKQLDLRTAETVKKLDKAIFISEKFSYLVEDVLMYSQFILKPLEK